MRSSHKLLAVAVIAAASTLLLTGCVEPTENGEGTQTFEDHSSAVDEYNETAETLELPEGIQFPEPRFADERGLYQSGYGAGEAVLVWNCAWGREYLEQRGVDDAAAAVALDKFAAIMDTETFKNTYDPVSAQPLFKKAVANAELGDPSLIQSLVDGGCPA